MKIWKVNDNIEAENLKYPCKVIGLQSTEARNLTRVKESEYYY